MNWFDILSVPSIGLLIGTVGFWAKRELKATNDRVTEVNKKVDQKIDIKLCKEKGERVNDRLESGNGYFNQIIDELKEQRKESQTNQAWQQESIRVIGQCLVVICEGLGGNGTCESVHELLKILSEEQLHGGR